MPRMILPSPRALIATPRRLVLPVGLRGCGSLSFDGVDDRVTGTNPLSGSTPVTLVAWVRASQIPGSTYNMAIQVGTPSPSTGFWMGPLQTGGAWRWGGGLYNIHNIATVTPVAFGTWHRVVYRHYGADGLSQVAVDGVVGPANARTTPNISGTSASLGANTGGAYLFKGNIYDARVYTRAWSDAEIAADYRGEWVDPTGLARWWTGENPGYGSTCREEIGGTNDPITGALWSPNVPMRQRRVIESARSVA